MVHTYVEYVQYVEVVWWENTCCPTVYNISTVSLAKLRAGTLVINYLNVVIDYSQPVHVSQSNVLSIGG